MPTHRGGNSKSYALHRLAEAQQYALLRQVKAGKITARAAMVESGLAYPKMELRLDTPYGVVQSLRRRVTPQFLAEVRRLLNDE